MSEGVERRRKTKRHESNDDAAATLSLPLVPSLQRRERKKRAQQQRSDGHASSSLLVLLGTYHSVLAGIAVQCNRAGTVSLQARFSVARHTGCVHGVAACERFIASSGSDEKICAFRAKEKYSMLSDMGHLSHPSAVMCLAFPDPRFLLCGDSDGTLSVYRTRDWTHEFSLQVHEGPIVAMALHPPTKGNLVITVSTDRRIGIADMNKGRVVTTLPLRSRIGPAFAVQFTEDGEFFAVVARYEVRLYATPTAKLVAQAVVEPKQPQWELQCASFAVAETSSSSQCILILGTESASLLAVPLSDLTSAPAPHEDDEQANDAEEKSGPGPNKVVLSSKNVLPQVSEGLDEENEERPAATLSAKRVCCLQCVGSEVIATESDGRLTVYSLQQLHSASPSREGTIGLQLLQRGSMQCGGRVTCLAAVRCA